MRAAAAWLHRRAENIAAGMLAVMFAAFLVQIVFRYFFNFPVGWASELTVVLWLWLVLFGSAFVLREEEEIRFDLLYSSVGPRARRLMTALFGVAVVALYGMSLPAAWSYVAFMKVEKSSYLKIPMNWLYAIFIAFSVAVIVRYLRLLWRTLRRRDPREIDVTKLSSGL